MQAHHHTSNHYHEPFKASARLALWTFAWTATLALATFGHSDLWDSRPALTWAAVALNLAVGIGWIVANARYLRDIDELQKKIMLDALAVTLGAGWVGGFAYVVANDAGLVSFDAEVGLFAALLGVVYLLAIAAGHLRYR